MKNQHCLGIFKQLFPIRNWCSKSAIKTAYYWLNKVLEIARGLDYLVEPIRVVCWEQWRFLTALGGWLANQLVLRPGPSFDGKFGCAFCVILYWTLSVVQAGSEAAIHKRKTIKLVFLKKTPEYAQEPSRISSSIMNTKKFQKHSRKILKRRCQQIKGFICRFLEIITLSVSPILSWYSLSLTRSCSRCFSFDSRIFSKRSQLGSRRTGPE